MSSNQQSTQVTFSSYLATTQTFACMTKISHKRKTSSLLWFKNPHPLPISQSESKSETSCVFFFFPRLLFIVQPVQIWVESPLPCVRSTQRSLYLNTSVLAGRCRHDLTLGNIPHCFSDALIHSVEYFSMPVIPDRYPVRMYLKSSVYAADVYWQPEPWNAHHNSS